MWNDYAFHNLLEFVGEVAVIVVGLLTADIWWEAPEMDSSVHSTIDGDMAVRTLAANCRGHASLGSGGGPHTTLLHLDGMAQ